MSGKSSPTKTRPRNSQPRSLTGELILKWAKAHRRQTGQWPTMNSTQPISGAPGESWRAINRALSRGRRGLPGGDTLRRFLLRHRGASAKRVWKTKPRLTTQQIIQWVQDHRARTGHWPTVNSGPVIGQPGEVWGRINSALASGSRGFPGGDSLRRLIRHELDPTVGPPRTRGPRLTIELILEWADEHHRQTGQWPTVHSGLVAGVTPATTWVSTNAALVVGLRGLPGGSSLARVLADHRGVPRRRGRPTSFNWPGGIPAPTIAIEQILRFADDYHARTWRWPRQGSGAIPGLPGATWGWIDDALRHGRFGLPPGQSLVKLLGARRGVRRIGLLPRLSEADVLSWADAFYHRKGRWPDKKSGPIPEAPGDTWGTISKALFEGERGLPGRTSLLWFLRKHARRP